MAYSKIILETESGEPLGGRFLAMWKDGKFTPFFNSGIVTINKNQSYEITTGDKHPGQFILAVRPDGYKETIYELEYFTDGDQPVTLVMPDTWKATTDPEAKVLKDVSGFSVLQMAILAAGIYFIAKKKNKKVGELKTGDILPWLLIAVGVFGFSLIKKFLETIGIWDSKETKDLDSAATNPNSFWSPNFWRSKPSNIPWSYAISQPTAEAWANDIDEAFGPFNDDEEAAIAVFKRARTKANISFLSEVFSERYGQDLLTYLRGGWWPQDRLSDSDVAIINNYVSRLPNY